MGDDPKADGERSLDIPTMTGQGRTSPSAPPRGSRLGPGAFIEAGSGSRYEILEELGRGGMAEVYRARRTNPRGFVLEVALKRLLGELGTDEGWERMFLNEVEISKHLSHPGIAHAHDLEEIDGRLYLVLEFVDGVSMKRILRAATEQRRSLPLGFVCHVGACVAEALHHAHTLVGPDGAPLGIVHRDVSGSNVMVTRDGIPKLLDFGVAYARLQNRDRTATGEVRGTYAYLSPEQAAAGRAAAGQVDGRADLFGLGLLLVELLTGERVFKGEDGYIVCKAIAECSRARVQQATLGLPRDIQRVCRRLLEKDPSGRFQSGEELARELRAILAERDPSYGARECAADLQALGLVSSRGDKPGRPTRASGVTRRKGLASRSVAVAAALVVGLGAGATGVLLATRRTGAAGQVEAIADARPRTPVDAELGSRGSPIEEEATAAAAPGPAPEQAAPSTSRAAPTTAPPALEARRASIPLEAPRTAGSAPARTKRSTTPKERPAPVLGMDARQEPPVDVSDRGGQAPGEPEPPPPAPRSATHGALIRFADRGIVANAAATLPRGTILRVRLGSAVRGTAGSTVEAMLTEDIVSKGSVVVPKGSVVVCWTGSSENGRLALACDGARDGERSLVFSAIALGDGDRSGLRLVEGVVPAGTSFTVYVTASAVLE